ncbi:MAG: glutathione peroxidase [Saprospirales bacterium]|nr:MAG: glutathione peroxidase [Saprospirales bacterium]
MDLYEIAVVDIFGEETTLEQYKGKVLLIVNVASKCGLTPQYEDLQKIHEMYEDQGLVVLGFPSNDFMGQELDSEEEILEFCSSNYGVTFPMFSRVSVKGRNIHPLYYYLTNEDQNGVTGSRISWNFQKYLIDRQGEIVEVISPRQRIFDDEILEKIKSLL